ncbi:hypothetical protein K466DRAFT_369379 [Polyporus arcularius HHB13444]|uniref:Uncharacterized protein n=1 Tax=Polyporus arcularius HHB13444 TaxID=1314778 RepID=A0A5C3PN34_9APHY|nr:hypothetical protein K466DRAFT_369379 [Polyporus arcularius HHB13444]
MICFSSRRALSTGPSPARPSLVRLVSTRNWADSLGAPCAARLRRQPSNASAVSRGQSQATPSVRKLDSNSSCSGVSDNACKAWVV